MPRINNPYAYAARARDPTGSCLNRALERVDAEINRRMALEQEYVYVVQDREIIIGVCAGFSVARVIQSTHPGSVIVKKQLIFRDMLFD